MDLCTFLLFAWRYLTAFIHWLLLFLLTSNSKISQQMQHYMKMCTSRMHTPLYTPIIRYPNVHVYLSPPTSDTNVCRHEASLQEAQHDNYNLCIQLVCPIRARPTHAQTQISINIQTHETAQTSRHTLLDRVMDVDKDTDTGDKLQYIILYLSTSENVYLCIFDKAEPNT